MRGFAAHPCLRRFQKGKTRSRRCYFNAFTRLYITLFAIHDSEKCAGANPYRNKHAAWFDNTAVLSDHCSAVFQ